MDPRVGAQIHDDPREPEEVVSAAISSGASTCWPRRGRSVEAVTATVSRPLPVVSVSPGAKWRMGVPVNPQRVAVAKAHPFGGRRALFGNWVVLHAP